MAVDIKVAQDTYYPGLAGCSPDLSYVCFPKEAVDEIELFTLRFSAKPLPIDEYW